MDRKYIKNWWNKFSILIIIFPDTRLPVRSSRKENLFWLKSLARFASETKTCLNGANEITTYLSPHPSPACLLCVFHSYALPHASIRLCIVSFLSPHGVSFWLCLPFCPSIQRNLGKGFDWRRRIAVACCMFCSGLPLRVQSAWSLGSTRLPSSTYRFSVCNIAYHILLRPSIFLCSDFCPLSPCLYRERTGDGESTERTPFTSTEPTSNLASNLDSPLSLITIALFHHIHTHRPQHCWIWFHR